MIKFFRIKASIGGVLGLGFGFSIMSAFEMIYYVCIRWYFIKKKTRIIEIQRQVNDSVDNDRLNSALGILLHPVPSPSPRIVQAINNNFNTDYGGGFPN